MYQNEMKEGFIKDYLRSRVIQKTTLYGLFRKIEPYEEDLQKDISEFTRDEALAMYTGLKSRSIYTLMNNNTVLKAYCAWVKYHHGLKADDVYEKITIDDLKPCVDKNASKLLSKEEIIEIEDQLLNVTDAAIVQCLFEAIAGPSMRDITELNESMLDKENKCLVFPDGRVFDISDRLCNLLEEAFQEETYICYGETLRAKQLKGKGKLFKDRDNVHAADSDDRRFRAVYRKIRVIRDYVGIKELTMKGIAASGFLYYLRNCLNETGLGLKEFLQTESGEQLMLRYGYESEYKIDNIIHRFKDLI
jgi:hypothetical protein